ncbi:AEC family transporter [Pseudoponticoccus marisrubri]|uniref:Malonate transporter n=1 Tax=Pseudoponticoccus marisrubri TaxID=1685382 RepID=A0A0W7WLY7_9RHOB|nr:AEC family transporter [Pseudoponticoccus marisrubri]KUF11567.1 malonate transporter [Pseudoponticoccus marisrubri]
MLHVLTHNILPVFAMLALGFALGRTGQVRHDEAGALNRVAFLVLQPALLLPLIAGQDWSSFRPAPIAAYAGSQVVMFALAYLVARKGFGRDHLESWLLAMATMFVNTLLYIWPISYLIYGEAAALPITAVVSWDSAVTFSFFIVTTDLMAGRSASRRAALARVARNPVLIAIALGAALNLAGLSLPAPVLTAMDFAGAGAAPLTLFALGVILSGHALLPSGPVIAISALKLLAFPALVWAGLHLTDTPTGWETLFILAAAGPSGAMAFALAMLYGVRTDVIAPVIIWTSTLSLLSLAWLA